MKKTWLALLTCFVLMITGCSHTLEVKNLSDYQSASMSKLPNDLSLGISTSNTNQNGQVLVTGAAQAISGYVTHLVYPYSATSSKDVDVIVKIAVKSNHQGSGANFFINFPGFLVWAPAWNGYVYKPSYAVDVNLVSTYDSSAIDSFSIPINLDVRHASIGRTWTEISWFEFGAIALIGGVVFTQYDDDITPLVEAAVQKTVGDYIAQEIATRLHNSKKMVEIVNRKKGHKQSTNMEPVPTPPLHSTTLPKPVPESSAAPNASPQ